MVYIMNFVNIFKLIYLFTFVSFDKGRDTSFIFFTLYNLPQRNVEIKIKIKK